MQHFTDRSRVCGVSLMMRVPAASLRQARLWDEMPAEEPSRRKVKLPPAFRWPGPVLPVIGIKEDDAGIIHRHALGRSGRKHLAL